MKKLVCLISVLALLLSCTACSAADILEQLNFTPALTKDAVFLMLDGFINGRTPTSAAVTLQFEVSSTVNDNPVTTAVAVDGKISAASPTDSYAEGTVSYSVNDATTTQTVEIYNFTENDNLVTFTHTSNPDKWVKTETSVNALAAASAKEVTVSDAYSSLLLEEGTQTLGDKEVYLLTGTISGEAIKALPTDSLILHALNASLQNLTNSNSDLADLDFSTLNMDMAVYLDSTSGEPVQIELEIGGGNRLLSGILSMLPNQTLSTLGRAVSLSPIRVVFSHIGFDSVTLPTISEEARIGAMHSAFNPAQADGSYVLLQYVDAVSITPPANCTVSKSALSHISYRSNDDTCAIYYALHKDMSAEDFMAWVENGMIPPMEEKELAPVSTATEAIGDFQTHSILGDGVNVYIACRTVGDSLLGIYVEDSNRSDITTVLTPILESVTDYHIEY